MCCHGEARTSYLATCLASPRTLNEANAAISIRRSSVKGKREEDTGGGERELERRAREKRRVREKRSVEEREREGVDICFGLVCFTAYQLQWVI